MVVGLLEVSTIKLAYVYHTYHTFDCPWPIVIPKLPATNGIDVANPPSCHLIYPPSLAMTAYSPAHSLFDVVVVGVDTATSNFPTSNTEYRNLGL